jgi:hypothetical protein
MAGRLPDQQPARRDSLSEASPELLAVPESASRLQQMVPDAVLADLRERFDVVLEALESEGEWVTNRVVPGKVILGQLGTSSPACAR